jgi:hypothetical protein
VRKSASADLQQRLGEQNLQVVIHKTLWDEIVLFRGSGFKGIATLNILIYNEKILSE